MSSRTGCERYWQYRARIWRYLGVWSVVEVDGEVQVGWERAALFWAAAAKE